jgi:hypothetical protein
VTVVTDPDDMGSTTAGLPVATVTTWMHLRASSR